MTRRWRHKSPKNDQTASTKILTPTASLGYPSLSLFCPDAQKFTEEWKTCQKKSGDMNGNRLSSGSSSNQSASNGSQSNLSALNSLLRRSLPSLNNAILNSSSSPTSTRAPTASATGSSRNQPPPLPSRRELEQRENDRLFERQLKTQWRRGQDDEKMDDIWTKNGQYKLLPADPVPVLKLAEISSQAPPPLPPKIDAKKRGPESVGYGRKDIPAHYKILPPAFGEELPGDGHDPIYELAPPPPPPPLPPRRIATPPEERPAMIGGYKILNSLPQNDPFAFYNRLPDPVPTLQKISNGSARQSLETEV